MLNALQLHAQSVMHSFTQGYLVKMNGDTLKGNIASLSEEENSDTVYFKQKADDAVTTFLPEDVKMFKREGNLYFSKQVSERKQAFVKLIEKGKVNLYLYSYQYRKGSDGGSVNTNAVNGPVALNYKEKPMKKESLYYLEKSNGEIKKISRTNQRGDLWAFFKGDDEMVKKVKEQKLEYEEIPGLIKEHNKK